MELTGTVLEKGTGAPIPLAAVTLLDLTEDPVRGTLADQDGQFRLEAPGPGRYRLQVERLGYRTWTSSEIEVDPGGPMEIILEVPPEAIPLAGFVVEEEALCPGTPEERQTAYQTYLEVRDQLDRTVWAETEAGFDFVIRRIQEIYDWRGIRDGRLGMQDLVMDTVEAVVPRPIASPSPEQLLADGYATPPEQGEEDREGFARYFAPDASVLASEAFFAGYCLYLDRHEFEEWDGLRFEPKFDRKVVDVAGVLWVDAETRRPQRLEFRYVGLRPFFREHEWKHSYAMEADWMHSMTPSMSVSLGVLGPVVDEDRFGGTISFDRVAGLGMVTAEWEIRTPRLHMIRKADRSSFRDWMEDPRGRTLFLSFPTMAVPLRTSVQVLGMVAPAPGGDVP